MTSRMTPVVLLFVLLPAALFALGGREEAPPAAPAAGGQPARGEAVLSERLTSAELARMIAEKPESFLLIDVRTPGEYASGAIPKAVNIAYDLLPGQPPVEDRATPIVVYCRSGNRSAIAAKTLAEMGYANVTDFGGINRWEGELVRP